MVFRDGEKITLQPNSELDIVKYDYQQAGKKDQMLFKLAAGGMRALTGSIGKKDHSAYALDTPVATIGIRGTESETVIDDAVDVSTGSAPVYNHVTEGSISVTNAAGETILGQGQSSVTTTPNSPTVQVPSLPQKVTNQLSNTPSPKTAPDADKAFDKPAASSKSGTYATVNKGSAKLESNKGEDKSEKSEKSDKNDKSEKSASSDKGTATDKGSNDKNDSKSNAPTTASNNDSGGGKSGGNSSSDSSGVTLSEGESSFAGESGGAATKLDEVPTFIAKDDTPPPSTFDNNVNVPTTTLFSPTPDSTKGGSGGCEVK
jgi:hypothetical protein